jgi:hypothetical protein
MSHYAARPRSLRKAPRQTAPALRMNAPRTVRKPTHRQRPPEPGWFGRSRWVALDAAVSRGMNRSVGTDTDAGGWTWVYGRGGCASD